MFQQRPVTFGTAIPIAGSARFNPQAASPRMAQAVSTSPRVTEARRMLDEARQNLRSVEDNLSMLDTAMGPEAALQAVEEGQQSVARAQEAYDLALLGESA